MISLVEAFLLHTQNMFDKKMLLFFCLFVVFFFLGGGAGRGGGRDKYFYVNLPLIRTDENFK